MDQGDFGMSPTGTIPKLIETKKALAKKYTNLARICGSRPRQKRLLNRATAYAREAQRIAMAQ
jgi:hypothetical protein